MHRRRRTAVMVALIALVQAPSARAQQVDAHVSYVPGDEGTHYPLVGAGVGVRLLFDVRSAFLGTRLGIDYAREEHLGPGRGIVGLDVTLSPHRETSWLVPYGGVGLSLNWSGGSLSAWDGVRGGLEGVAGVDIAAFGTNFLGLMVEERFGKVDRLRPAFATRVGFIAGF
jgi:hypothetical protein